MRRQRSAFGCVVHLYVGALTLRLRVTLSMRTFRRIGRYAAASFNPH